MDTTARVRAEGRTNHVVEIAGPLPVFWAGNVAAALAARNIGIVSGRGTGDGRRWTATLTLDARQALTPPDRLDMVALANTEPAPVADQGLKLSRFACAPLPDGRLEVKVFAPDQPGFLSRLLRKMALVSLFPREFEIETPNQQIQDRFVLGGVGGAVNPSVRQALEKLLGQFTA